MMRWVMILLISLSCLCLFLQNRLQQTDTELPVFLRTDNIANAHQTKINITLQSQYQPSATQLESLKDDYQDIWAHLNYLYVSNDVKAGKEYYTEAWFRQVCNNYNGNVKSTITRSDLQHHLFIKNWLRDGLVCTAIDNITFQYQYPDNTTRITSSTIAIVLLYQGDHWRIDAMKFINETKLK